MPNPTVELDVNNTDEMPDELYTFLCEQFVNKAKQMGYDIVESDATLDNWRITCEVVNYD